MVLDGFAAGQPLLPTRAQASPRAGLRKESVLSVPSKVL